jgi:hypothetical protein
MRFSEAWLREMVDPPIDTAALVAQLSMSGLEVDAVEPAAPRVQRRRGRSCGLGRAAPGRRQAAHLPGRRWSG